MYVAGPWWHLPHNTPEPKYAGNIQTLTGGTFPLASLPRSPLTRKIRPPHRKSKENELSKHRTISVEGSAPQSPKKNSFGHFHIFSARNFPKSPKILCKFVLEWGNLPKHWNLSITLCKDQSENGGKIPKLANFWNFGEKLAYIKEVFDEHPTRRPPWEAFCLDNLCPRPLDL